MATLASQRAVLNRELGVIDDAETSPWPVAARNAAIVEGYKALYRMGVWKPATQTTSTVDTTWGYTLTTIRDVDRVDVLDSSSNMIEEARFTVDDDGSGGTTLTLAAPIASGYSMAIRGWRPYSWALVADADADDLPEEWSRLPILKAKVILYRQQLSSFMRYRERLNSPAELNVTVDGLVGTIAAAEREWEVEARRAANRRRRSMRPVRVYA